jgi:hypothetical protein
VPGAVEKLGISIPAHNAGGYTATSAAGERENGSPSGAEGTSFSASALSTMEVPVGCRFCGGTLPEGRTVTYCPHCGQNLAAKHCEGCGAELDLAWKFCINCGKRA